MAEAKITIDFTDNERLVERVQKLEHMVEALWQNHTVEITNEGRLGLLFKLFTEYSSYNQIYKDRII